MHVAVLAIVAAAALVFTPSAQADWGYAVEPDPVALTSRYVQMNERLEELQRCNGLSAAIYTQTTDVETKLNGLMTYDRAITKPDAGSVRRANQELIAAAGSPCETGGAVAGRSAGDDREQVPTGQAWRP